MEKNIIPVVLAADNNYLPYLAAAVQSLIEHANSDCEYRVYIFVSDEINEERRNKVRALTTDKVTVEVVDITSLAEQVNVQTREGCYLTKEASYRLWIDYLFPQYEKVLYLDCDVIVNNDVALLFEEDISDFYCAAVYDEMRAQHPEELKKEHQDVFGIPIEDYFNSGVMLINIKKFRENRIGERGLKMLEEKPYPWMDQDVLNILCQGHVKLLDNSWNALIYTIGLECATPYIIHYAGGKKPWDFTYIDYMEIFWKNASKTQFYTEMLDKPERIRLEEQCFSYYAFPWSLVAADSRVIIYGGGNVGKVFLNQVKKTGYCKVVAVCDKAYKEMKPFGDIPVISISQIDEFEYDSIVISIDSEQIAQQVEAELVKNGVDKAKICWKCPKK